MNEVRQEKQLKTQLNNMIADAQILKIEAAEKQREYNLKLQAIERLKKEIEKLNSNQNIKVSEHAIVRYFERVKGYDIKNIENEIVSEKILKMIETLGGTGKFPNEMGYKLIMQDYTVTTIV